MSRRNDTPGPALAVAKKNLLGLGGSVLAIACVPRVSATLVIDETKAPEPDEPEPDKVKPEPRKHADARGPLDIVRAEQITASQLRLHFSKPLGPLEGFDPNDFRVSVLNVYINQSGGYSYAYYYDFGYQSYGQVLRFTAARAGEVELDLHFSPTVPQHYCRQLDADYNYAPPGVEARTGLFLHYAAGAIPIRDEAGNPLRNFGAEWVMGGRSDPPQTRREMDGGQAQLAGRGLIPIACGPEIPPGPR